MSGGLGGIGEFGLIRALTEGLQSGSGVAQGPGDDCAVIEAGGAQLLLTCDASLEGVHFHRDWGTPQDIGWKAAASALSDIAAMGGRAHFALVTLGLPDDVDQALAKALYQGIADAVETTGAAIIGGDTTGSRSGIVLDLAIIGEVVGRPVMRSGARPGDVLAVTGMPGRRGAGLHALLNHVEAPALIRDYLHPHPRIEEGEWLQGQEGVRAMIDVSDGLLPDAGHIAEASGLQINLHTAQLPEDRALAAYWAMQDRNPGPERLRSGEEYELLVALAPDTADAIGTAFQNAFGLPLTVVGTCEKGDAQVFIDGSPPQEAGFQHFQ